MFNSLCSQQASYGGSRDDGSSDLSSVRLDVSELVVYSRTGRRSRRVGRVL